MSTITDKTVAGRILLLLPASVNVNGGLLEGTGGIFGNVSVNGGTIQAGVSGSPGFLSINEISGLAGGTMLAELGGPGDYEPTTKWASPRRQI